MGNWWYSKRNKKHGPIELNELRQLFQKNKINLDTMVWQEGMNDWQALDDVDKLNELKNATPPELPPKAPLHSSCKQLNSRWTRFFARVFDISWETLLLFLLGVALASYSLNFAEWIIKPETIQTLVLYSLLPAALILDAFLYRFFGNTLGKFFLNLKVTTPDGSPLSLMQYFKRNFFIWTRGFACGIPFIHLFTMINQYNRLSKGKKASYDESMNLQVETKPIGWIRKTLFTLAFTMLIFITTIFNNIAATTVYNNIVFDWDAIAYQADTKTWNEIANTPYVQSLSKEGKLGAKDYYWEKAIKPNIQPELLKIAHKRFFSDVFLTPVDFSLFNPFKPGLPWSEVISQDKYKTLSIENKKRIAQRYFNNAVLPQILPEDKCSKVAMEFASYVGFDIKCNQLEVGSNNSTLLNSLMKLNTFDQFDEVRRMRNQ